MTEYTDVKWIKLMTGLFDSEKIQLIESMPEADSLIVIWVKLLCLAGKINNGGVFVMGESIVYTEEMLATVLHRPVERIRRALEVFEQLDMAVRVDGVLTLPGWSRYQSLDTLEKKRDYMKDYMRDYRDRQRRIAQTAVGSNQEETGPEDGARKPEEPADGKTRADAVPGSKTNGKANGKANGKTNSKLYGKTQEQNREEKNRTEKQKEKPRPKRGGEGEEVFREFAGEDDRLLTALKDFDLMRSALRKPMTDRARELLCRKLLTFPEAERTAVLEQSVAHSWTDLYPLDRPKPPSRDVPARNYGTDFYAAARSLLGSEAAEGGTT